MIKPLSGFHVLMRDYVLGDKRWQTTKWTNRSELVGGGKPKESLYSWRRFGDHAHGHGSLASFAHNVRTPKLFNQRFDGRFMSHVCSPDNFTWQWLLGALSPIERRWKVPSFSVSTTRCLHMLPCALIYVGDHVYHSPGSFFSSTFTSRQEHTSLPDAAAARSLETSARTWNT